MNTQSLCLVLVVAFCGLHRYFASGDECTDVAGPFFCKALLKRWSYKQFCTNQSAYQHTATSNCQRSCNFCHADRNVRVDVSNRIEASAGRSVTLECTYYSVHFLAVYDQRKWMMKTPDGETRLVYESQSALIPGSRDRFAERYQGRAEIVMPPISNPDDQKRGFYLKINQLTEDDEGLYTCQLFPDKREVAENSTWLEIVDGPCDQVQDQTGTLAEEDCPGREVKVYVPSITPSRVGGKTILRCHYEFGKNDAMDRIQWTFQYDSDPAEKHLVFEEPVYFQNGKFWPTGGPLQGAPRDATYIRYFHHNFNATIGFIFRSYREPGTYTCIVTGLSGRVGSNSTHVDMQPQWRQGSPCYNEEFCLNGGSCYDTDDVSFCRCATGFSGMHCQHQTSSLKGKGSSIFLAYHTGYVIVTCAVILSIL